MRRILIFSVLVLLLAAVLWLRYDPAFLAKFPELERRVDLIAQEIRREISAPPGIRREGESTEAILTRAGVIQYTNLARRAEANLPPLAETPDLNAVARIRMKDMFDHQYFEHNSPLTGAGAAEAADEIGYDFIAIGENIALGHFEGDDVLVQAWMDSPGHRKNILHSGYSEIGVAVGRGLFEGKNVWLGVQIFARPLSACPQPDGGLRARTDAFREEISALTAQAESLRRELEASEPRSRKEIEEHNRKVDQYNFMVARLDALTAEAQAMIAAYNAQVDRLNACIED